MPDAAPEFDALKIKQKATWMAGDFGKIAESVETHAEAFVARRAVVPGMRVLDVACGTGNAALQAARAGADVVGVDIATNLLEQARARAERAGVPLDVREGDAEDLPFEDGTFDLVLSMYGAMFAPRPDRVAAELLRVCRPGGRIAMANWPPDSFIGVMAKLTAAHVPPPAGVPSPLLWGDEEVVRERLQAGAKEVTVRRVKVPFRYPFSPADTVEFFRRYYGPTQRAFEALSEPERRRLRRDLEDHWDRHNRATDGTVDFETELLEVDAVRA